MVRARLLQSLWCLAAMLAIGGGAVGVWAADNPGHDLLDKATEAKLGAENIADLNQVVRLCQEAIAAGLDDPSKKFANDLLAGTLAQRADLFCHELFERPVQPGRAQRLVQMAIADLEQSLKIDPDQAESQYLAGRLYAHLGESEKGLTALNNAIRLSSDDAALRSKALMIRANLKSDPKERQADYDEAVKLQPHQPDVLRFRGMYHLTQNNLKSAIEDLKAATVLDPDDAETFEALGLAQSMNEEYEAADASFTKAIELAPESDGAFSNRGRVRAIQGDNDAALKDIEQALKLQPGSVAALQLHAQLLGSKGKFDEALADMGLLMRAMPENPELMLQVAQLCQLAKQPKRALAAYDRTLQVSPRNAAAYRGRADVYLSMGMQAEAVTDYQQALKVEPKNSGVLNNLAWLLATSPEKDLRDGPKAIELAKLACEETDYKAAHILSTLAAGYAETGDFATAINWSKKAVELGNEKLKPQLDKELQSYVAGKPWRESMPPEDEEDEAPAADDQSAKKDDAALRN